eukprot:3286161-Pleurochrysis_carterae.AAC.2
MIERSSSSGSWSSIHFRGTRAPLELAQATIEETIAKQRSETVRCLLAVYFGAQCNTCGCHLWCTIAHAGKPVVLTPPGARRRRPGAVLGTVR